jgi:hypothetical protein
MSILQLPPTVTDAWSAPGSGTARSINRVPRVPSRRANGQGAIVDSKSVDSAEKGEAVAPMGRIAAPRSRWLNRLLADSSYWKNSSLS